MRRAVVVLAWLSFGLSLWASDEKASVNPSFDYDVARTHEIKPHRRTIQVQGEGHDSDQLRLTLTISPTGDVLTAKPIYSSPRALTFWPQVQDEVLQWKFTPFEDNGRAVTAEVEEYIDFIPPEQLPRVHVAAPVLKPDSKVAITLRRSGCFGSCPAYVVTVSTEGVVFDGNSSVVASGRHTDKAAPDEVRKLAKKFVAADFYSMDSKYVANVTDCPTYVLSISIDGRAKDVEDYMGQWEGMPAVIPELEDGVDSFARTQRWIDGEPGLVQALRAERFDFQSFGAQVMLKETARRGKSETVRDFLAAGVPLYPLPAPSGTKSGREAWFEDVGLLTSASHDFATLQVLIGAGASRNNQNDKDLALVGAASSGDVEAARALIAYGANPNADLSRLTVVEDIDVFTTKGKGEGSVLISAAASGNPEMVREILRYHPNLEARDHEGKTAIFAAGDYRSKDAEGARVECVRLLAEAGADVNARDNRGDTPLHGIFLTDVEEELLKLGADVNARNNDGETPIFTTVSEDDVSLFVEHGADLNVRNKKGESVIDVAKDKPLLQEGLTKALEKMSQSESH